MRQVLGFMMLAPVMLAIACQAAPRDPLSVYMLGEPSGPTEPEASVQPPPPRESRQDGPVGPITLERALALARERNPDVRAAAERIGAAQARVGEAASAFYPQVGARLSYSRTDNPAQAFGMIVAQRGFSNSLDVNDPGATENYRPEVYGAINLYRGGQDGHLLEAARHGLVATEQERDAIHNILADAVTATFLALLAAREHVVVAQASAQAVDSELAEARKRFNAGAILKSDVLSLEVRLAVAKEGQVRTRNAVEHAKAGLRLLLALGPDEPVDPAPGAEAPGPDLPATFQAALARALAERPELRVAANAVRARQSEVEAERGSFLPRVDVFGSYGQDYDTLELDNDQDNWTFGVVVELDLFSGFQKSEKVRGGERRTAEARALEDKARLQVEQEVKSAMLALEEARERVTVTGTSVAAADEAMRLVREQYQGGTTTVTRYLEVEVALADARSRSIVARFDVRRAEAGVRKAVGSWK
jgi:outer membrane protein